MRGVLVLVGSKSRAKLLGVERAFARFFEGVRVEGVAVRSGVSRQPVSLKETLGGAVNRAKAAWRPECDYSVGIEAGLFPVEGTMSGFFDTACCAVFDGKTVSLGLSPSFEHPKRVVEEVLKGKEVSQAFEELWRVNTRNERGAIGYLTDNVVPRHLLHEMGVYMALTRIVSKRFYGEG